MASTNKTTNFELPQWVSTDKPTFEGDLNSAFLTIDNTMESNKTTAETGNANANNALEKIGNLTLLETTVKDNLVNAINEIVSGGTTPSEIGDLSDLTTSAKNNLVSAINEVNETAQELTTDNVNIWSEVNKFHEQLEPLTDNYNRLSEQIGTLTSLTTTAKNNLVSAINEVNGNHLPLINSGNATIKTVPLNAMFEDNYIFSGTLKYVNTSDVFQLWGNFTVRNKNSGQSALGFQTLHLDIDANFNVDYIPIGTCYLVGGTNALGACGIAQLYTEGNKFLLKIINYNTTESATQNNEIQVNIMPIPITNLE